MSGPYGKRGLEHHETMWAEMQPNMYGGETCDQPVPQWRGYTLDDKEDEGGMEKLELAARTFPPGTLVTITVPLCPQCKQWTADYALNQQTGEMGKCECGFDWPNWAGEEYS